jgi:hypothetical protein
MNTSILSILRKEGPCHIRRLLREFTQEDIDEIIAGGLAKWDGKSVFTGDDVWIVHTM